MRHATRPPAVADDAHIIISEFRILFHVCLLRQIRREPEDGFRCRADGFR